LGTRGTGGVMWRAAGRSEERREKGVEAKGVEAKGVEAKGVEAKGVEARRGSGSSGMRRQVVLGPSPRECLGDWRCDRRLRVRTSWTRFVTPEGVWTPRSWAVRKCRDETKRSPPTRPPLWLSRPCSLELRFGLNSIDFALPRISTIGCDNARGPNSLRATGRVSHFESALDVGVGLWRAAKQVREATG